MERLGAIQEALREAQLDGWLFYDFHNRDVISYRILGLDLSRMTTRRWYYFIPATGAPRRLCHSVEPHKLDQLPGEKKIYLSWQSQHQLLKESLAGARRIAMQYSPNCLIPYVSLADAGTVELVRSFGVEVVSSANLVQRFEAHVSETAYMTHVEASRRMHALLDATFARIGERVKAGAPTEHEIQQFMLDQYRAHDLTFSDAPIVAVNAHASDPHFEPRPDNTVAIKRGDRVLIDLWAKLNKPGSIYFDITWMGYVGDDVPARYAEVFGIARDARERAVALVEERMSKGRPLAGWEVDQVCRAHIEAHGLAQYFVHRTGHSIGEEVHGNGVNIDNLETRDDRFIVPGTLFSIEPGIYLPEFGVRTEIDCYVDADRKVRIAGARQSEIVKIAC
ncbi:MAG: M24 family metallopeptidase [Candidatus Riflebacteria bacterium]|nr:M24 family metallopeptidase [Candidatus Riflebacteria bacterium]